MRSNVSWSVEFFFAQLGEESDLSRRGIWMQGSGHTKQARDSHNYSYVYIFPEEKKGRAMDIEQAPDRLSLSTIVRYMYCTIPEPN
jgi:hypothetical protein